LEFQHETPHTKFWDSSFWGQKTGEKLGGGGWLWAIMARTSLFFAILVFVVLVEALL
jgi:hypothetical protein